MFMLAITPSLNAGAVYDSLSGDTDGRSFPGDVIIDDLHVTSGGLLSTIDFAVTAGGIGGSVTSDLVVGLALDGGNGVPDFADGGDDAPLFFNILSGASVPIGTVTEMSMDASFAFVTIPDNALLWASVQPSNPSVAQAFYGAPVVGSTDATVWSPINGQLDVPGSNDPSLQNSDALGFRLNVVPEPASLVLLIVGGLVLPRRLQGRPRANKG